MKSISKYIKLIPIQIWIFIFSYFMFKDFLNKIFKFNGLNTQSDDVSEIYENLKFNYDVGFSEQKSILVSSHLLDAFNYNFGGTILGGTDTKTINSLFDDMNHEKDYAKVFKAFGKQKYNGQGTANENNPLADVFDLTTWLKTELDFFDFSLRKKIKSKILASGLPF